MTGLPAWALALWGVWALVVMALRAPAPPSAAAPRPYTAVFRQAHLRAWGLADSEVARVLDDWPEQKLHLASRTQERRFIQAMCAGTAHLRPPLGALPLVLPSLDDSAPPTGPSPAAQAEQWIGRNGRSAAPDGQAGADLFDLVADAFASVLWLAENTPELSAEICWSSA